MHCVCTGADRRPYLWLDLGENGVVVHVVPYLVPLQRRSRHNLRMNGHFDSHNVEGGFGLLLFEDVQQARRERLMRPVVKGQCHVLGTVGISWNFLLVC